MQKVYLFKYIRTTASNVSHDAPWIVGRLLDDTDLSKVKRSEDAVLSEDAVTEAAAEMRAKAAKYFNADDIFKIWKAFFSLFRFEIMRVKNVWMYLDEGVRSVLYWIRRMSWLT